MRRRRRPACGEARRCDAVALCDVTVCRPVTERAAWRCRCRPLPAWRCSASRAVRTRQPAPAPEPAVSSESRPHRIASHRIALSPDGTDKLVSAEVVTARRRFGGGQTAEGRPTVWTTSSPAAGVSCCSGRCPVSGVTVPEDGLSQDSKDADGGRKTS